MLASWKQRVRQLKREAYALAIAARDPRVPWAAKAVIGLVLAHTFSPIDLIPDFIPVLGLLDDLIITPLGISLALRMIPAVVMVDARERADQLIAQGRPVSWVGAALILATWIVLAALAGWAIAVWLKA